MPVHETLRDRRHRQRASDTPAVGLPPLSPAQAELLAAWARDHVQRRGIAKLRQLAGPPRLDQVEPLAMALLNAGWARLHERHEAGQWWLQHLEWTDLPRLQALLGLPTRAQQDQARTELDAQLAGLAADDPALLEAVQATLLGRLGAHRRAARLELLQGLARWRAEQRSGLQRDFALHARPHTKAISELEWAWLRGHFDLEAWGIEPLAHILWLAGAVRLQFGSHTIDLAGMPFVGLPQRHLATLTAAGPVQRHWLVENRTSFERQAGRLAPGVLLAWLPGRPSRAWCEAWGQLLRAAPAPVDVSADADPAGVDIALAAGAVCTAQGVAWQPRAMEPQRLDSGRPLALNAYDRQALARLQREPGLPTMLAELVHAMTLRGVKHEQEAWL
jgi:hypothetical protein